MLMGSRFIPSGSEEVRFDSVKAVAYYFASIGTRTQGMPSVVAYEGRKNKPSIILAFPSEGDREEYVKAWIARLTTSLEQKVQAKREKKTLLIVL